MTAIKKKIEKDIYGVGSIGLFTDLDREVHVSAYFMIFDYLLVPFILILIQNGQSLAIRQKPGLEEHSGLEKARTTTQ